MGTSEKKTTRLKAIFNRPGTTLMPFGVLPIHARMAEQAGFEAFEVSGGLSAWWLGGVADVGYMTMTEVVQQAASVVRAVEIPVYCDADTGYGGPVNVRRTVQEFIRVGVAGIHIEDQSEPKKAGGRAGIRLVSDAEAIGRLQGAIDARDELDPDFVIVARTDGYGAEGGGLEEAIRRGVLYKEETGADVIFYEGLNSWEEVRIAIEATPGPAYAIPSRRAGRTLPTAELAAFGQKIQIVPFILPGIHEVWKLLLEVRNSGEVAAVDDFRELIDSAAGSEQYVGWGEHLLKPGYDDARLLEERYLPKELQRDYANTGGDED
ncbi:isocitrate lyase/PEP mutase family protein [Arthrobacter sp. KNU-44]|uniref:isocitrate lyase/PEP mutase family protein n=1 Tax=Arthrobacter sp. KNU-44 TaxID=3450744 RepID=UPI003F429785